MSADARAGEGRERGDADLEGISFRLVLEAAVLGEHGGQALDGSACQWRNIFLPSCAHHPPPCLLPHDGTKDATCVNVRHVQRWQACTDASAAWYCSCDHAFELVPLKHLWDTGAPVQPGYSSTVSLYALVTAKPCSQHHPL